MTIELKWSRRENLNLRLLYPSAASSILTYNFFLYSRLHSCGWGVSLHSSYLKESESRRENIILMDVSGCYKAKTHESF